MKTLFSRLLLFVAACATAATAQSFSKSNFPAGSGPGVSATADVNRDGFPDLIVANTKGTPGISVLLSNGNGTFKTPISSTTLGQIPDQIAVGDLNGDGIPDVAYVSTNLFNLAVMYGRGDGTFSSPVSVAFLGGRPNSLAIADFDLDGRLDLLYGTDSVPGIPSKIQIAFNTGNDSSGNATFTGFRRTVIQATGEVTRLYSVTTGDMNADGRPDLAFLICCSNEPSAPVIVAQDINNADGSFTPTEPDIGTALRVVAHDFGDGHAALVLPYGPLACNGCFNNQGFSVIFNLADGTTRKSGKLFSGTQLLTGDVAFGDYNDDGLQDLVLTASGSVPGSSGQDELLIWETSGTRTFSDVAAVPMGNGQMTGSLTSTRLHKQVRGDDITAVQALNQNVSVLTNITSGGCLPDTPGVLICEPVPNANTGAQVTLSAGAVPPSGIITALRFYIDNQVLETFFNTTGAPLLTGASTNTFPAGRHLLVVVGYTSTGGFVQSSLFFTVH